MSNAIMFLGSGCLVWFLTYTANRLWLGFKSITGGW